MVLNMLKLENNLKYKNITQQYGFINPKGSNIVREISPLRTRHFISFFQHLKKKIYRVTICFSAPELTILKTLILSGFSLNIKRFVYKYMLRHEDNRMRGWRSK